MLAIAAQPAAAKFDATTYPMKAANPPAIAIADNTSFLVTAHLL